MFGMFKFIVPVLALGLSVLFIEKTVRADEAPAKTGSVKVTVLDADSKPVVGAHVRIVAPKARPAAAAPSNLAKGDKQPEAVKEGVTGDDGTVTLSDIAPGDYYVMAMSDAGRGREKVTITAGATPVEVTVHLKAKKPAAAAK